MILTVKERGRFVATMRYVHVQAMEMLAAWVPTTPEMEVKLLFGEHIWDVAQHADAFGKRAFELRLPLQHSLLATESYLRLLKEMALLEPTAQRIAAFYDVFLPGIVDRYRHYLDRTDSLSDAPTVRILERHLTDVARMVDAGRGLRQALPDLQQADANWMAALSTRETAVESIVAPEVDATPA